MDATKAKSRGLPRWMILLGLWCGVVGFAYYTVKGLYLLDRWYIVGQKQDCIDRGGFVVENPGMSRFACWGPTRF